MRTGKHRRSVTSVGSTREYVNQIDVADIIKQLRSRLYKLNSSIVALERLAADAGIRKRGRAPKWMKEAKQTDASPCGPVAVRAPAGRRTIPATEISDEADG